MGITLPSRALFRACHNRAFPFRPSHTKLLPDLIRQAGRSQLPRSTFSCLMLPFAASGSYGLFLPLNIGCFLPDSVTGFIPKQYHPSSAALVTDHIILVHQMASVLPSVLPSACCLSGTSERSLTSFDRDCSHDTIPAMIEMNLCPPSRGHFRCHGTGW